jgi:hypothetical protein
MSLEPIEENYIQLLEEKLYKDVEGSIQELKDSFDVATTIKKIANGNFVVVGNSRGSFDEKPNNGQNDFWLFEIDNKANSNIYWQKTFGGSNIDVATDFYQTSKKELIVVGESQSNNQDVPSNKGGNDLWVIKLK